MTDVITFAVVAHGDQKYGSEPYKYHLDQVWDTLQRFGYNDEHYRACAYLHDVIEDTDFGPADIIPDFGMPVYLTVWACTGVGDNRKSRQRCILDRLSAYPKACPVKLADRIANIEFGLKNNDKDKFLMYLRESIAFRDTVKPHVKVEMWKYLENLMEKGIQQYNLRGSGQEF